LKREGNSRKQLESIRKNTSTKLMIVILWSNKRFKVKKDFESVLNDEIKKAEEASDAKKKFKRDNSDDTGDEEVRSQTTSLHSNQHPHSGPCSSSSKSTYFQAS
jgi:hypothetical protein